MNKPLLDSDREGWPPHVPLTFHKGLVTDGNGNPSKTDAYLTYGSAHGENEGDAEITIHGSGASNAADAIESIPAMVEAIEQALDDMGEDGHCVCEQAKQMLQSALAKARGIANGASQ